MKTTKEVNPDTTLCLACSSSLPPIRLNSPSQGIANPVQALHITDCCKRPICPACIFSNPRLVRYNPCLACLGGVDLVGSGSTSRVGGASPQVYNVSPRNVDGAVRDEDNFIVGDDEEEGDDLETTTTAGTLFNPPVAKPSALQRSLALQAYQDPAQEFMLTERATASEVRQETSNEIDNSSTSMQKYYLSKNDTLQGISFRFGVDRYELCRLNNLPPSTLTTTPNLLHTRSYIKLPLSIKLDSSSQITVEGEKEREAKRLHERAVKRLQTLTKEVDWRVAEAYVALADDPEEQELFSTKRKEIGDFVSKTNGQVSGPSANLESLAVDRYLDDSEWEAMERAANRGPRVAHLPLVSKEQAEMRDGKKNQERRWWQWN